MKTIGKTYFWVLQPSSKHMNNYIKLIYISLFFSCSYAIDAQVYITNPSLEDAPADATMPSGWFAASKGTTPDILPGYWGVYIEPENGNSYAGLITRTDGSYESIGQRLENTLEENSCYEMALFLSHSDNYTGYNGAIKLRVWISNKKKSRKQMIFESPLIDDEEWKPFNFNFYPERDMKYIILEAYNPDKSKNIKGNILIDGLSNPTICNRV